MLSVEQRAIVIGTVLGDGYLSFDRYQHTQLEIKQSDKHHAYVDWMFERLRSICPPDAMPRWKRDTNQWRFTTRRDDELAEIRAHFYPNGKKIVPRDIARELVSPLTLAVWFMDDGSLDYRVKDHYNFALSTNAFSIADNELLREALERNFNLHVSIQTPLCRGKRYPEIYIGAKARDRFLELIEPYVIPCFRYKIPPLTVTPQRLIRMSINDLR